MAVTRPWDAIVWWEARRIPFNLAVLVPGLFSLFSIVAIGSLLVPKGEDFVEPMLLPFGAAGYAVMANILYTLSWVTELLWSGGDTSRTEAFRKRIFWLGLTASIVLTLVPAALMSLLWMFWHF